MSDQISNLPLNKYSNPTTQEIEVIETLFDKTEFDIKYAKFTTIICFLHILSILILEKYKIPNTKFILLSTLIMILSCYLSVTYII